VDDGTLDVRHGGKSLHSLSPGDSFGESSLLFRRPISLTVVSELADCRLHEIRGSDVLSLVDSNPAYARALGDMCRKRMFQKAMKSHLLSSGLGVNEVEKSCRDADRDGSGTLSLTELATLMHNMGKNSSIPEKDVKELLDSLDLDGDG
jgi:CRP-like cAMP-binding protein